MSRSEYEEQFVPGRCPAFALPLTLALSYGLRVLWDYDERPNYH